jgi:hypothetical protein
MHLNLCFFLQSFLHNVWRILVRRVDRIYVLFSTYRIVLCAERDCKRDLDLLDTQTSCDYTLQITITHRLVFSVTVFIALLGSGFQQWTFLGFSVKGPWPKLAFNCQSQPQRLLLYDLCLQQISQSARTTQKTFLPIINQNQNYITNDGQAATLSWWQAPIRHPRPIFPLLSLIIFRSFRLMRDALSDERVGL